MKAHRSHSYGGSWSVLSNIARFRMRGMGEVQNPTLNMCQKMGDTIVPAAPSGTVADVRSVPASTGMQGWAEFTQCMTWRRAKLIARLPLHASVSVRWRRVRQPQCVQAAAPSRAHSKPGSSVLGAGVLVSSGRDGPMAALTQEDG